MTEEIDLVLDGDSALVRLISPWDKAILCFTSPSALSLQK